ncbi:MAG TPA: topology modulation protein [Bacillales bacterium]|nr:topology modulation protein [Bacillales bacterium]
MKRIMVIGVSAGVGKSTFARKLGEILDLKVHHLDTLYWKPGWVEASIDEFAAAQEEIIRKDQWIIEGNYSNTHEIRAAHADTIIYLEVPLALCLFRVVKRWWKNRGKTRSDLGEGCPEKIDLDFIWFICSTYYPRKRKRADRIQFLQSVGPQKTVHILKGKKEIQAFLDEIKKPSEIRRA